MELNKQVTSYERSVTLKEQCFLSHDEQTLYCWVKRLKGEPTLEREGWFTFVAGEEIYPAYTASELFMMLPTLGTQVLKSNNGNGKDIYSISFDYKELKKYKDSAYSLVDLLAAAVEYLLRHNYINHTTTNI